MDITKEYLNSQIKNLEEQKGREAASAQSAIANVSAIDGALQALKGLVAYSEIPVEPIALPDENPDAVA